MYRHRHWRRLSRSGGCCLWPPLLLLLLFLSPTREQEQQQFGEKEPVRMRPNLTDFSCEFAPGERCLWTWEEDDFGASGRRERGRWPGRSGFFPMSGSDVAMFSRRAAEEGDAFYGPAADARGSDKGRRKRNMYQHRINHMMRLSRLVPWERQS